MVLNNVNLLLLEKWKWQGDLRVRFRYSAVYREYFFIGYLFILFFTGGGSRADIASLVVLRPLSVVACGIALFSLSYANVREYWFLFVITLLIFLAVGMQLVPLPMEIWHALPGRELLIEIDRSVGLEGNWRPISMTPEQTWNAFYSLFVPLSILLFMVQSDKSFDEKILNAIIIIGVITSVLAVSQIVSGSDSISYLYRVTNKGSAVGLFANRNHQADFLAALFPMLATFSSINVHNERHAKTRILFAALFGGFIIPLILVTGSRQGVIAAVIALISCTLIYSRPTYHVRRRHDGSSSRLLPIVIGLVGAGLVCVTTLFSRAEALKRFTEETDAVNMRSETPALLISESFKYFPFGSGYGSFAEIYQIVEPRRLLGPSYFNHAHNDWLELFMTGGAGLAIAFICAIGYSYSVWKMRGFDRGDTGDKFAIIGATILLLFALTSVVDYPLRVPSLASLAVICAVWLARKIVKAQCRQPPVRS